MEYTAMSLIITLDYTEEKDVLYYEIFKKDYDLNVFMTLHLL